ncbi:S-adenosyl-L-methionine-dependent methyltransferase [Lasiosphaeria miniovina]|uniref:tRNA N(3)-methylcytidine methyltransferase n=1 Tax=Lasiosphaeria miniovina TaxID=1954250 RepID=A0AA40B5R3_9PEZI|nr:S-adenosyl-L-methionine-dependent methyltransferase [Lasiosphaeria miniovina]KAK0728204.1 S-adenosyl-L-methionine-dependent methyltransferase [Lasiosphaeria miniovina]
MSAPDGAVVVPVADLAGLADGQDTKLAAEISALEIAGDVQQPTSPHRSHDPQFNQKRSDPFQFGSRLLQDQDDPFEFNAWDHVETDDAYKEYAEQQYEMQRQAPVSDFDKYRFNSDPAKWWNQFYKNNTANFFKDRKWLQQEFPILNKVTEEGAGPKTLLEIGAGAGNTAFPILSRNKNPLLKLHACDFSKKAVEVMRAHESYNTDLMQADVWDVAGNSLPPGLEAGSVDLVLMVFIFSALSPLQWKKAVENVYQVLKPGGEVCFRDYGRGDLAQVRFKKGRYLEENFYIRGDGTRVYFFEKDELADIWSAKPAPDTQDTTADGAGVVDSGEKSAPSGPSFEIEELGVDRRMLVNRAKKLKMYRCWLQGRFRKKE